MSFSDHTMPPGTRKSGSGGHGRYRTEIDGMRAIAVLAVVLFHLGLLPTWGRRLLRDQRLSDHRNHLSDDLARILRKTPAEGSS
jgi:hypothetical protein